MTDTEPRLASYFSAKEFEALQAMIAREIEQQTDGARRPKKAEEASFTPSEEPPRFENCQGYGAPASAKSRGAERAEKLVDIHQGYKEKPICFTRRDEHYWPLTSNYAKEDAVKWIRAAIAEEIDAAYAEGCKDASVLPVSWNYERQWWVDRIGKLRAELERLKAYHSNEYSRSRDANYQLKTEAWYGAYTEFLRLIDHLLAEGGKEAK